MAHSPLSSKQVLAFLPLNTWTKVILLSNNNDVYIATTEDRMKKRLEDMNKISLQCSSYEKVIDYKSTEIVGVEIDGKWFRGKLISYNEFLSDNTIIELIDVGSTYHTKLQNLFILPYFFKYEPLALPIKFKDFTPKTTKLFLKPLLSESMLHEGVVLVDVDHNNLLDNTQNKRQQLDTKTNLISVNDSNYNVAQYMTNGHDNSLLRLNSVNNSNNVQSMTNGLFSYRKSGGILQCQKKTKELPLKNKDYCIITFFEDFSCIYVSKAKYDSTTDTYDIIDFDIILKTGNSTDKIPKYHPVVGDIVKVFSTEHNGLFRAKVLRNNDDGTCKVFYIDFGNMETVQSKDIYVLTDELKKPGLAVQVGINNLKYIQVNEQIKNMFNDLTEQAKPFMIEFDETTENCLENVKLIDLENGTYINNNYILRCLPNKIEPSVDELKNNTNTTLVNENTIKDQLNIIDNNIVYLKHFEDMDNVYVVKDVKLFNEVMLMLNVIQYDCSKIKTDYNVGDIVKVSNNKSTYRAKIKKIDANLITVENIDFGFCDVVQSDSIYELSNQLLKIPGLAIKISIEGPFIKKTEALMNFINNTEKIPLYLDYDKCNSNKYQKITLRRKDNLENVFDEFIRNNQHIISNEISNNIENNIGIQENTERLTNNFQSIILKNGDYCIVSYFKDFKNIYVCKAIKNSENIYEMHNIDIIVNTIQSDDIKIKPSNVVIGDIVKVLSPSFHQLYRAKVTNIENDDFYVSYIDFGNEEIIHLSDIFELSDELKKETLLPIRISIEVPPNSKTTNEIQNLFLNLIDNNVVLSIEYEKKSINGLENVTLKQIDSGNSVNNEVLKLLPVQKLPIQNGESCIITHFENFNHIYILKVSELDIIDMLTNVLTSEDRKLKSNPAIGDIVKVKSPLFNEYYRAKIVDIENNVNFHVYYIDFGSTEVVQSRNIFELSDDLIKKPGMTIRIGINVQCNVKQNEEITKMFTNLAENAINLFIEFDESREEGLKHSTLKVISNGLNINDEVLRLFSQSSVLQEKLESTEKIVEPKKTPDIINRIKSELLLKNGEEVNLRYFLNLDSVFVSRGSKEHSDTFLYMMNKVQEESKIKLNIEEGDIVKGLFEDMMYRAKVLKKVDQDYLISFIDFGNEEIVQKDAIFELPDELKKFPDLSIQIGIKGSAKIENTDLVIEYFDKLINECIPLYIEYDEKNPNGLKEVSLKNKDNCDILDELLKIGQSINMKEEAIQIPCITESKKSPEPEIISSIELKNGDIVYCCNFEDFSHIYLCKSSNYNAIQKNINLKEKDTVVKKNLKYGDIVRVKFEDKIVRAKILNNSKDIYSVFLMDIGKNIDIVANNIFDISNDLKNIPGLAKKVGLKGTMGIQITKTIRDYFYNLWHDVPVPLILICDEDNLNYLNEVNLKKVNEGHDIIDDLLLDISKTLNGVNHNFKHTEQNPKVNGSNSNKNQYFKRGDHVQIIYYGGNLEYLYIRSIKMYDVFKTIIEQLKKEKRDNLMLALSPKVHDIVAVYSSKYNGFYRAKIIINETDKFKCAFSDYGYFEIIACKDIFVLPNYILPNKVPNMVYRITLAGQTRPVNNTIAPYLSSLIDKILVLDFDDSDDVWYKRVVLKELNSCMSINDEIQQLLISNNSINISQQRRLERKIILPKRKECEMEKPFHPLKSGSAVYITHFENFNSIFVRNASYDFIENFNTFNKQMLKYYKNVGNNCSTDMLKVGDKVCVRSILNMVMYSRALIINKSGNEYNVFYFDYGNTELVNVTDIFELPKELEKAQNFVLKVQLQNMPPLNTKNDMDKINDYFKKKFILTNTSIIIEFNELNSKGLDDVILKTEFYNKSIADEIKDLLVDSPIQLTLKTKGIQNNAEQQSKLKPPLSPYTARRHFNVLK